MARARVQLSEFHENRGRNFRNGPMLLCQSVGRDQPGAEPHPQATQPPLTVFQKYEYALIMWNYFA
jgi:hypothetical protein